jgi:hypothetical protein
VSSKSIFFIEGRCREIFYDFALLKLFMVDLGWGEKEEKAFNEEC